MAYPRRRLPCDAKAGFSARFLSQHEDFLKLSGSDTVENVVRRSIGEDTTDPAFWAKAIKSLEEPLKRYKDLLAK